MKAAICLLKICIFYFIIFFSPVLQNCVGRRLLRGCARNVPLQSRGTEQAIPSLAGFNCQEPESSSASAVGFRMDLRTGRIKPGFGSEFKSCCSCTGGDLGVGSGLAQNGHRTWLVGATEHQEIVGSQARGLSSSPQTVLRVVFYSRLFLTFHTGAFLTFHTGLFLIFPTELLLTSHSRFFLPFQTRLFLTFHPRSVPTEPFPTFHTGLFLIFQTFPPFPP